MARARRSRARVASAAAPPTCKYILTLNNGDTRMLTIPEGWRITYGAGARNAGESSQFRVYNGTKLVVVWRDVKHITLDGLTIENKTSAKRVMNKMAGESVMQGSLGQFQDVLWHDDTATAVTETNSADQL